MQLQVSHSLESLVILFPGNAGNASFFVLVIFIAMTT